MASGSRILTVLHLCTQGNEEKHASRIQFRHFDLVPEAKDHHFNSNNIKKKFGDGKSCNYATIMREWKILESNLPEDIYVQVYETRIDLLRAVIIGAPGTPYHDGLFFFDILLPPNYPEAPPSIYYHSHGYYLNPNLYKGGRVCLSLINTWHGRKTEMWTKESTILQVLVSIQGLVLNERPYFNEPLVWFKSAWYQYNEKAFILSCKTMLRIMHKPPENFEDFVTEHFHQRAAAILLTILDYRKGNMFVGCANASSLGVAVSKYFRTGIMDIYSEFKIAFARLISQEDLEKIEKMENEEHDGSSSGSNSENRVSKWKGMFVNILEWFTS